jgi:hypothetical protein
MLESLTPSDWRRDATEEARKEALLLVLSATGAGVTTGVGVGATTGVGVTTSAGVGTGATAGVGKAMDAS